jgi:hypothetical protein
MTQACSFKMCISSLSKIGCQLATGIYQNLEGLKSGRSCTWLRIDGLSFGVVLGKRQVQLGTPVWQFKIKHVLQARV